jgi:hypothetical protein
MARFHSRFWQVLSVYSDRLATIWRKGRVCLIARKAAIDSLGMIGRFYQAIDGNRGFSQARPAGTEPGFPNSPIFPGEFAHSGPRAAFCFMMAVPI